MDRSLLGILIHDRLHIDPKTLTLQTSIVDMQGTSSLCLLIFLSPVYDSAEGLHCFLLNRLLDTLRKILSGATATKKHNQFNTKTSFPLALSASGVKEPTGQFPHLSLPIWLTLSPMTPGV